MMRYFLLLFLALSFACSPSFAAYLNKKQELLSGTVNNSNTSFTISNTPQTSSAVVIYEDGLALVQGTDYTISGKTITMTTAPNFFETLYADYDL